jgi:Rrf2 family protein
VKVSARFDYAVRAVIEVAAASNDGRRITADEIANRQMISWRFLQVVLATLLQAGLLTSTRGTNGGYELAMDASQITVGAIGRAVEGALLTVNGALPEQLSPPGLAAVTQALWTSVGASVRSVLDGVTVADLLTPGFRCSGRNRNAT